MTCAMTCTWLVQWLAHDNCTWLAHDLHMTCTWLDMTWLPNLNPLLRDCSIEKVDIGDKTTTTNTGTRDDSSSSKN